MTGGYSIPRTKMASILLLAPRSFWSADTLLRPRLAERWLLNDFLQNTMVRELLKGVGVRFSRLGHGVPVIGRSPFQTLWMDSYCRLAHVERP